MITWICGSQSGDSGDFYFVGCNPLVVHRRTTYLPTYLSIYLSMSLQPFVGPWPLFEFLDLFTQSVGHLGRGISPSQGRYLHTGQHEHRINAHRHPFLKWDSNRRSQCLRRRRQFMPYTARSLWSAHRHTTKQNCARLCLLPDSCWILSSLIISRWRWRQNILPKCLATFV
jgi:hypothetical protein